MGNNNIQRLKKILNLPESDIEVEKYLNLIDKIYYENEIYCEEENEENNTTSWKFSDGTEITMNEEELCKYLLIVDILEDSEEMFI